MINDTETFLDVTDPVYEHFQSNIKDNSTLVKVKLITKAIAGPKEPRKLIEVTFCDTKKVERTFSFNYLKLKRMIDKGEL